MRDFKRLQSDPPQGVNGSPKSDSIMLWNAVIFGPDDTPWDGGSARFCQSVCLLPIRHACKYTQVCSAVQAPSD